MDTKKICNRNDEEWGDFVTRYETILENTAIQSSVILYSVANAKDYLRVCEVGVGCGLAARMFVTGIMKKGATYFASDLADGMNKSFTEGFKSSDLALNPKIKYEWIEEAKDVDVSDYVEKEERGIERRIFHLKANNEKLPYSDEVFDCYLSSLSLNLVDNHKNQLSECFRVLQKGAVAGFTVLGRIEKCNYVTLVPEVIQSLGHEIKPITTHKHPAHLGDRKALENDFREAGFSSVKSYYTNINFILKDQLDLYKFMADAPPTKHFFENLDDEQMEEFMTEYKKQYNERFGLETSDPLEWEILVVIAIK
ncbi:unnamed protein product [Moneuplotes crassus]|uniref:Methyltransferase type 11 domain-containing protein n=1 Tax=Euplotes crassus TaxID=5936 RepID=A0AAD1XNF7_EUPCR|nr:unnamed protein product [Moneuplotes crassus]